MVTGNRLASFGAAHNEPPDTAPATFDIRGDAHPVWDMDALVDESTIYSDVLPAHYSGLGITVKIHYAMSSAVSPTQVRLDGAFERIGDEVQDIDSASFATAKSVTDTVPVTNGHTGVATLTFTNSEIDDLLVGEEYRFKVTRDADHADDDAAGDLEIKKIVLDET